MATINRSEIGQKAENSYSVPPIGESAVAFQVMNAVGEVPEGKNPRVKLECEVIAPDTVENKNTGAPVDIKGLKATYYLAFSEKGTAMVFDICDKLGVEVDEIDPQDEEQMEALAKQFDDLMFQAIISSSERTKTEQDPENPGKYRVMKGIDGKPLKLGHQLENAPFNIVGLVTAEQLEAADSDDEGEEMDDDDV